MTTIEKKRGRVKSFTKAASLAKALGHPERVRMLAALAKANDYVPIRDLLGAVENLSEPNARMQLDSLRNAGIVDLTFMEDDQRAKMVRLVPKYSFLGDVIETLNK